MKWEYETTPLWESARILGMAGWELVCAVPNKASGTVYYYFKRPIQEVGPDRVKPESRKE